MKKIKALPSIAKDVVESFWVLFSAKKYLPLPGMRAGKACAEKALEDLVRPHNSR